MTTPVQAMPITTIGIEVRSMRQEDWESVRAMTVQGFAQPVSRVDRVHSSIEQEEGQVLTEGGQVRAALRIERIGQFFGGCSVRSAGIASVVVAPEFRGKGAGTFLLSKVLRGLRAEGVAISTLFPTSVGFYRSLGYEIGGAWTQFQLPIRSLPRKGNGVVDEATKSDFGRVTSSYRNYATTSTGLVDRSQSWWNRRVLPESDEYPTYSYLTHTAGRITGYVIYSQCPESSAAAPYSYSLLCHDLVWEDVASIHTLLRFISSHVALGIDLIWPGPVNEPLGCIIDSRDVRIYQSARWMIRLVDVVRALESRGYPRGVSASVEFAVDDPIISENNIAVGLGVAGGHGKVTRLESASNRIPIGVLGSIYTGWMRAGEAQRLGHLPRATPGEIHAFESIFAGSKPWVMDRF